jgi:hypothetical protein
MELMAAPPTPACLAHAGTPVVRLVARAPAIGFLADHSRHDAPEVYFVWVDEGEGSPTS